VPVIATEHQTHRYGRLVAVDDLRLVVQAGSIYGFLGPNGAGKTTTIRMLLGFLRPSAGRATIFGLDCWHDAPQIKRDVGYLPGDLRLYPGWTGHVALDTVGRIRGVDLRQAGRRLASRFDLDLAVRVRAMSRGMRQKLGLLLALAHRPRLIVLDEPTASLDPLMQEALMDHLRGAARDGATIFFSSHTLSEVEALCNHVAIIREGRIVADEALESLRARARRQVTIVFRDEDSASRASAPEGLVIHERAGPRWRAELDGDAPALVRWAATQPIADLAIHPPDLTRIFQVAYQGDGGVRGTGTDAS
jgi:ABC-2 type transport system ATP-binding protein